MALKINGTEIKKVICNDTILNKVICNDAVVFNNSVILYSSDNPSAYDYSWATSLQSDNTLRINFSSSFKNIGPGQYDLTPYSKIVTTVHLQSSRTSSDTVSEFSYRLFIILPNDDDVEEDSVYFTIDDTYATPKTYTLNISGYTGVHNIYYRGKGDDIYIHDLHFEY